MAKIRKNQGGSEMRFESGGSLNFATGGELQLNESATTHQTVYELLKAGNNTFWFMPGSAASPVFSGSPGDLLWLPNSASTALWVNLSDGSAGSKWGALNRTDAGSQIPGAR